MSNDENPIASIKKKHKIPGMSLPTLWQKMKQFKIDF